MVRRASRVDIVATTAWRSHNQHPDDKAHDMTAGTLVRCCSCRQVRSVALSVNLTKPPAAPRWACRHCIAEAAKFRNLRISK